MQSSPCFPAPRCPCLCLMLSPGSVFSEILSQCGGPLSWRAVGVEGLSGHSELGHAPQRCWLWEHRLGWRLYRCGHFLITQVLCLLCEIHIWHFAALLMTVVKQQREKYTSWWDDANLVRIIKLRVCICCKSVMGEQINVTNSMEFNGRLPYWVPPPVWHVPAEDHQETETLWVQVLA